MNCARPAILIFATAFLVGCDPGCRNNVLEQVQNLKGPQRLVVFVRDCGATTGFSTQVSILGPLETLSSGGNVFSADTDHGAVPRGPGGGPVISVRWTSVSSVEIAYVRGTRVFRAETTYGPIPIHISYVVQAPSGS